MTCDRSVVFSGFSGFLHSKTDHHDITEILLKVALNVIKHKPIYVLIYFFQVKIRPKIPQQDNDNLPDNVNAELSWKHHRMLHESIIVELFQVSLNLGIHDNILVFNLVLFYQ